MIDFALRMLTLVRHGSYMENEGENGSLSATGIKQIRCTAAALTADPFDRIVYSPVARAAESAHIIAEYFPGVPLVSSDLLRECLPPVPATIQAQNPHKVAFTRQAMQECETRLSSAWKTFAFVPEAPNTTSHDLLVCHGNVIRFFAVRALNVRVEVWTQMAIHNGGITRIGVDIDGLARLISLNDIGHLPANLRTF